MTPEDRLAALIEKGTPLPWKALLCGRPGPYAAITDSRGVLVDDGPTDKDAALIVAAVNSFPAALAVIRAARSYLYDERTFSALRDLRAAIASWDKDGAS